MSIGTSTGFVNFTNGTPRAEKIIATSNIGVGTNSPIYNLDVAGDINFTGTLYQNGTAFSGGGGGGSVWTTSGSDIYYDSGNVGIGTSTPTSELDVNGAGKFTTVTVPSDGGFVMNGKNLVSTTGLYWDQVNNRLGIGTTSPSYKLHVAGTTRLNQYAGSRSGTFSGSGTFNLPGDLDYGSGVGTAPAIGWEIHMVFGFTGTNLGTFYISGCEDTSGSIASSNETSHYRIQPGGTTSYGGTCYLTANRENYGGVYYAKIILSQAYNNNVAALSNPHRFHMMYECVGCHANIGANKYQGSCYFVFADSSRRPKYIRLTCSTGTVSGNYMINPLTG